MSARDGTPARESDDFRPPIQDRPLPPVVADMREEAEALRRKTEEVVAPLIERWCDVCDDALEKLGVIHSIPLSTTDLDLGASTQWAAVWPLAMRALSLGRALVYLVRGGYGVESFPTVRSIHEANRLLIVFCRPGGEQLTKQWLEGRTPKPSTIAKAMERIGKSESERRVSEGLDPIEPDGGITAKLYRALSEAGHTSRESMDWSLSHSQRTAVIGPDPDYGVRAYHVELAAAVVWEIVFAVGHALYNGYGSEILDDLVHPLLDRLAGLDTSDPFPRDHVRMRPIEFEEI
jgi:hypothetical protein